jgi:hypothetical protein
MRIICKRNNAKDIDLNEVTTVLSRDESFPLVLNKEYIVMGMSIPKDSNCLYYLVDEDDKPAWYPYVLFEIANNLLPDSWYLQLYDKKLKRLEYCVIGFDELTHDSEFYARLESGDKYALAIYFAKKDEMDIYLQMFE